MSTSVIALVATLALWLSPFAVFAAWLVWDRREQRRLRHRAHAALETIEPGAIVEVRPHLYVVADRQAVVIHAEHRFAARRAVAGGPMGGSAA